ncbi:hypothetical protein Bsp3421_001404 [Burkholderia sp. FERM BP-3421]|jgi:hypothetical protein|uniref:hypothetical protein n=1 Tax=Burkholderia sp. FERM BP-3421 TaxID=1494466 RepID=UPI00235E6CCF|nr:hypothetical protein [Burkholderia sp. FERM BP-3421]WDD91482.1 hypothetical protein Bsp3421_001404 [Burkholderia sp. FERM BP-3421]
MDTHGERRDFSPDLSIRNQFRYPNKGCLENLGRNHESEWRICPVDTASVRLDRGPARAVGRARLAAQEPHHAWLAALYRAAARAPRATPRPSVLETRGLTMHDIHWRRQFAVLCSFNNAIAIKFSDLNIDTPAHNHRIGAVPGARRISVESFPS